MSKKNLYIVPYDFTPVSEKALEYALFLGKHVHTEILLLHLAPDKPKGMVMKKKLEELKDSINSPIGVDVSALTRVGNIFTDIGKIAKEMKAQLIIMGTHGKRGLQSITGSHAMKVVTSAECPFLVVQKDTKIVDIKNVVVPIDLTKESMQIVNIAGDMAHMFKAQIHVLAEKQTDQILNQRIKNRISIIEDQYKERDNHGDVFYVKKGNYGKRIMEHVKANDGGMIAIAYHTESLLPQFDSFAQNLMTNKLALPFLIVNSKLASSLYF